MSGSEGDPSYPDDYPVDEVGFTVRALTFLHAHGLNTIGQAAAKSKKEFKLMGANKRCIQDIEDGLRDVGRTLR